MLFKYSEIKHRSYSASAVIMLLAGCMILNGCKKIVSISGPADTITTTEAFNSEADAESAITGLYFDLVKGYNSSFDYGNGRITAFAGLSADELNYFSDDPDVKQYQMNNLLSTNNYLSPFFWNAAYYDIYIANAIIEGANSSTGLNGTIKNRLTGEAKFIRAFIYFYMTNLFGDIPLVTTTEWSSSSLLPRSSSGQIYDLIISDLKSAQELLPDDYSASNGERFRANRSAASALLARVYLFQKKWPEAIEEANSVINSSNGYSLAADPNDVFLLQSNEAILQLQVSDAYSPYATKEANQFIPSSRPNYYLTDELLASFEPNDKRYSAWVNNIIYENSTYYYPYKYKVRQGTAGDGVTEYYMLLRLAEQYLIKAEALAQQNQLEEAISDLDMIRERAGLRDLDPSLTQTQVLDAVAQERRIEFFAEWGHRWFDLIRTGRADNVLPAIKPQWKPTSELYPIPQSEIKLDPALTQNPGY